MTGSVASSCAWQILHMRPFGSATTIPKAAPELLSPSPCELAAWPLRLRLRAASGERLASGGG
eukprot:2911982-Prorocentrum_lima.AAC.1